LIGSKSCSSRSGSITTGDCPAYTRFRLLRSAWVHFIQSLPLIFPDLALLHLGGTRLLGVMKVTRDGKDGVKLMQIAAPHHAIPIHDDDYTLFKSPLSDFEKEVNAAGLQDKVTCPKHGETYAFKPAKP
jgi:L-ascorbate metabolism protein UlaG (beta-lactamase superfamily)